MDVPSYQQEDGTRLELVALKVRDLDTEVKFYTEVIGFDILSEENEMAFLGIKALDKILLVLVEYMNGRVSNVTHNGLYQMSILLPDRASLASIYQHLLDLNYPIIGTSDHGYGEAVYLRDPEFNVLSLCFDRPSQSWQRNQQDQVIGDVERLDTDDLLAEAHAFSQLPLATKMGYVHLNVNDLTESSQFYQKIIGFRIANDEYPSVHYLTAGRYHHLLALNKWYKVKNVPVSDEFLGLDYIVFELNSETALAEFRRHLDELQQEYHYDHGKNIVQLDDPNGIHLWFRKRKKTGNL